MLFKGFFYAAFYTTQAPAGPLSQHNNEFSQRGQGLTTCQQRSTFSIWHMPDSTRPPLLFGDLEVRQGILILRLRDKSSHALAPNWWTEVTERCAGPLQGLWIDLIHCSIVSSSFIAGALQLLEHYRNQQLTRAHLINASDRIVRLVEIMNLGDYFVISQQDHNDPSPIS